MTGADLVAQAAAAGVSLRAVGSRIRYAPVDAAPADLLDLLRDHRGELLAALSQPEEWTLDQLDRSPTPLVVLSTLLGTEVLFAPDAWPVPAAEKRPVYRVSELRKLAILAPEPRALLTINELKIVFGGQVR